MIVTVAWLGIAGAVDSELMFGAFPVVLLTSQVLAIVAFEGAIGQRLLGLRIVTRDGARPGPLHALARVAAMWASWGALAVGSIIAAIATVIIARRTDALPHELASRTRTVWARR